MHFSSLILAAIIAITTATPISDHAIENSESLQKRQNVLQYAAVLCANRQTCNFLTNLIVPDYTQCRELCAQAGVRTEDCERIVSKEPLYRCKDNCLRW